jgi:hypothetical protein
MKKINQSKEIQIEKERRNKRKSYTILILSTLRYYRRFSIPIMDEFYFVSFLVSDRNKNKTKKKPLECYDHVSNAMNGVLIDLLVIKIEKRCMRGKISMLLIHLR